MELTYKITYCCFLIFFICIYPLFNAVKFSNLIGDIVILFNYSKYSNKEIIFSESCAVV